MSSLVIQTAFLGDAVLTTPLIAELAARGPVDVVASPAAARVLAGNPGVRTMVVYDKRGVDAGMRGFLAVSARVRASAGRYDAAFLAQASTRSAALAWRSGAQVRIGFDDAPGRWLYTARVRRAANRHQAERLWRLAFPTGGIPDTMPGLALFPGPADIASVDALLERADNRPLVTLAPGSVWATKRWPYFEQLAVESSPAARLAIIGGPDERSAAEIIRVRVPDAIDATDRLSILGAAELIRRSRVLVANDSAPTHLASAVGTPTVAIFGPTSPGFGFGPLAPRSVVAELPAMPCRPCHPHGPRQCPLGHWKCMRELHPKAVVDLVQRLIDAPPP